MPDDIFCEDVGRFADHAEGFFRNAVAAVAAVILLAKSDEGFKIKRIAGRAFSAKLLWNNRLICNFYAVDHLAIADANILNKLSPFFAIIMSYLCLRRKQTRQSGCAW